VDDQTSRTETAPPSTATPPGAAAPQPPGASEAPPPGASAAPSPPNSSPPLKQPAWRPPQRDSGRNASLVFGVIVLVVGLWFFATQTLGLDLPRLDWGQLWPIVLIAVGGLIVLNAMQRRTR
jgi:hypothetical protein